MLGTVLLLFAATSWAQERSQSSPPYRRAITKMAEPCSPDVDGNGTSDALTDGVLGLRYLFGMTGDVLTTGAVGEGASRSTAGAIRQFLDDPDCQRMLDVDGNGVTDALTDGVLFARFLFGFTQINLVDEAVGDGAIRLDAEDVASWLEFYGNPRFVVIEGTVSRNDELTDPFEDIRIRAVGSENAEIRILEGRDESGSPVFDFDIQGGVVEIEMPDPNREAPALALSGPPRRTSWSGYDVNQEWSSGRAIFLAGSAGPTNRAPGRTYTSRLPVTCLFKDSYVLTSHCARDDFACLGRGEPVLFVHGYQLGGNFGGREGTWNDFPHLLYESGYVPFEFRWRTNARFQEVAAELGAAILQISDVMGQEVHLVAHSFGGILVRTLLQEVFLQDPNLGDIADRVASVVTLGSPHSGVADGNEKMHGVDFPRGQDTQGAYVLDGFEFCGQISCHQMGEDVFGSLGADTFGVTNAPGEIAAELARISNHPLPDVDFLTLIGLTTWREDSGAVIDEGDALITGWGQRFVPSLAVERQGSGLRSKWDPLLAEEPLGRGRVTERILALGDVEPGDVNQDPDNPGYRHSTAVKANNELTVSDTTPVEPFVERCGEGFACGLHVGFTETLAWLQGHGAGPVQPTEGIFLNLRAIDVFGSAVGAAQVRLLKGSILINQTVTDPNGFAVLELPFAPNDLFTIYVNSEGLRSATVLVPTFNLPAETQTQLGDAILLPAVPAFGDVRTQVVDALSGQPVSNVAYTLTRIDHLNPTREGTTNANGIFNEADLLTARYVLRLEREGFEDTAREVDLLANVTNTVTVGMSPELQADGALRIVLTWGEDPGDLDSHLVKLRPGGSQEYHIFWLARSGTGGDFLDLDDVTSFGPETVTVQQVDPTARYVYSVHHFSGLGSLTTTSQARVTLLLGDGGQRVFNVPAGGEGRWWKVFEINGGAIEPCNLNCMLDEMPSQRAPAWPEEAARQHLDKKQ